MSDEPIQQAPEGDKIAPIGLSYFVKDLIFASVPTIFFWLLAEQFGDHKIVVCVLRYLAVVSLTAAVPLNALRHWRHPTKIWLLFLSFCASLAVVFFLTSRPIAESNLNPPFSFSLLPSDNRSDILLLTNDVLINAPLNGTPHIVLGNVLIPIQPGKSDFLFKFGVHSSEFAEGLEIFVTVPADWGAVPDSHWIQVLNNNKGYTIPNGFVEARELVTWGCRSSINLLPGDGLIVPSIRIPNITNLLLNPSIIESRQLGSIAIMAKARNLPIGFAEFRPFFLTVSNGYSHRPIVVTAFPTNNNRLGIWFPFPLVETNEFQNIKFIDGKFISIPKK